MPEMLFFVGGPGSGKTHVIETFYLNNSGFVLIDSDRIASKIYCAFDEDRQCVSKAIADDLIGICLQTRIPFMVHATGANYEKCERWFPEAKKAGYKTVLIWVKCPQEVAAQRNGHRERNVRTADFEERWRLSLANIPRLCECADEVRVIQNGEYIPGFRDTSETEERVPTIHDAKPAGYKQGGAKALASKLAARHALTFACGG